MENHQAQNWFERAKPFIAVLSLQFGYAVMDVLSKAAMNKGMSNYVFVVYRHAVAFIVITPFAVYFDKKLRPTMTLSIFSKIVALSLIEPVIGQNLYFLGLKYTTATFAASMSNMFPAIAFILACILRASTTCEILVGVLSDNIFLLTNRNAWLEKIKMKSIRSLAKVVGTLATVSGAMVMTLIKGPILFGTPEGFSHNQHIDATNTQHTIVGSVMITIGCFGWACFVILQAITLKTYPAVLSLASWICLLGTLQNAAVAMIMERGNPLAWSLKWDLGLLSVIYTGIVCSGLVYYLQGVVMKTRGPIFITAFSPLSMVMVAIMGYFILAEQIFLGRVIGAVVICLGLYLAVWGKSKDYSQPNLIIEEPVLAKQTADEGNAKNNHSTQEVITLQVNK